MYQIKVKDWRKIPLKNLEFILNQAEVHLKYTLDISDKITTRFYTTLVILVGLFTAGIGYFSNEYSAYGVVYNNKYYINLSFLIILLIKIFFFVYNISPRKFMGLGRSPHELANINLLQPIEDITEEEQYKSLLIGEINNLEIKLEYNTKQNQSRLLILKRLIYSIVLLATTYLILYQLLVL
ncbi:hypothetical protein FNO01nite_26270 [Flavobacterium noncentrifugens]|uniref:SMODS and SLOG-associating 2TM effector domain-containing protein n=1 Tax=Flavobacterium noncentrifugens TaxID=1128970 RepID=A0A1G8ZIB1_9FLAO|nr:hypothetical protein [Flavobacterium noncentrifugens]GEP51955.1 hypothetical protein FNO01nite_26270 [Flavobacterium noncentrifugens]SDK13870.1 hypothetical protein SAMN04487935_2572 [Flavobacterium noncentrifugens]